MIVILRTLLVIPLISYVLVLECPVSLFAAYANAEEFHFLPVEFNCDHIDEHFVCSREWEVCGWRCFWKMFLRDCSVALSDDVGDVIEYGFAIEVAISRDAADDFVALIMGEVPFESLVFAFCAFFEVFEDYPKCWNELRLPFSCIWNPSSDCWMQAEVRQYECCVAFWQLLQVPDKELELGFLETVGDSRERFAGVQEEDPQWFLRNVIESIVQIGACGELVAFLDHQAREEFAELSCGNMEDAVAQVVVADAEEDGLREATVDFDISVKPIESMLHLDVGPTGVSVHSIVTQVSHEIGIEDMCRPLCVQDMDFGIVVVDWVGEML